MCNLLMERCNDVLFPWTWLKSSEAHKQNVWAGELLKNYIDTETYRFLQPQ